MSNNDLNDGFDVEDLDDSGFEDYNQKRTLGGIWQNNPMVKIGVVLGGFALLVGGIVLFGGDSSKDVERSLINAGSGVNEAPGTSEISSTMEQAIEDKNAETLELAARTGGSAIPIPTEPSKGTLPVPEEEATQEDPLERWRQMQEERARQQQVVNQQTRVNNPQPATPPVDTKTPAVNALSRSMIEQMKAVNKTDYVRPPLTKKVTDAEYLTKTYQKTQSIAAAQKTGYSQNAGELQVEEILLPAGTIEYAQLILEANTDAPGPVLAEIMSGPLTGAKILGSFTSEEKYLTLNFSKVVIDGLDYPVQAIAVDPATTLPGMVTEIDHRYFSRIVLPMAASFVEGLTKAISDSGTTSVYIEGSTVTQSTANKTSEEEVASGISEAGSKFGDLLDEEARKIKPMLRIASGTPVGILFVSPVVDKNDQNNVR